MSLLLEMLQTARLAPGVLGESTALIRGFVAAQQNEDGGFKDRAGKSDLYYTAFGLCASAALQSAESGAAIPKSSLVGRAEVFLSRFGGGEGLDFVHLCCLARSWAVVSVLEREGSCPTKVRAEILRGVESYRGAKGGYHPVRGSEFGTAYAAYLALGAYQDLRGDLPRPESLKESIRCLELPDGGWTNERCNCGQQVPPGAIASPANPAVRMASATNATAAAVGVERSLGAQPRGSAANWLLARAHPQGGFLASATAPIPDLLSTATALHALASLQVSFGVVRETCLDFIDTLWTKEGGFYGHWADDHLDCEYTFYALLALGHLAQI